LSIEKTRLDSTSFSDPFSQQKQLLQLSLKK
jgi:hypothetical protein